MSVDLPRPHRHPAGTERWRVHRLEPDGCPLTRIWFDRDRRGAPDVEVPEVLSDEQLDAVRIAVSAGIVSAARLAEEPALVTDVQAHADVQARRRAFYEQCAQERAERDLTPGPEVPSAD